MAKEDKPAKKQTKLMKTSSLEESLEEKTEEKRPLDFSVPRRLPAVERKIGEIGKNDIRVSILGTVVDKNENVVIIDDGTGKIQATFDDAVNCEVNQLARIFGRIIHTDNGIELQGEICQGMSKIDLSMYRKVQNMWNETNV
jgi:hypothetical protein